MDLTETQRAAINHRGKNLQLIACAGSGKTEVVAQRIAHLLSPESHTSLSPRNIVAFTYNEKAAAELKDRIIIRCRETLGDIPGLAEMFVGTIHAFCLDILKTEVPKYLKFEILNEVQQYLFVNRHSLQCGLTACKDVTGKQLKRYLDTSHYLCALTILRESDPDFSQLEGCSMIEGLRAYQTLIDERCYLDYSQILESAVDVMTNDDGVRTRLAERIRYVVVDEYQDVNPIQEAIVWLLHDYGARVCVVGDDDQTIYQWRGSEIRNIIDFSKRYPEVKEIRLEDNFRSSEGIVETARAFIEKNVERLPKSMKPAGGQAYEPGDITALSFDNPDVEAEYIAGTIKALRGIPIREGNGERGISWSDMAILLRSVKKNGDAITIALKNADIPFVVIGMTGLFETSEAEAARQLFYFMADRPDVDVKVIERAWLDANLGVEKKVLKEAIRQAADAKESFVEKDVKRFGFYSIQRIFLNFLETAGIREERVPDQRGEVVFYNLGKFSQLISDFETIHYHSKPIDKYSSFANFLQYQAESAYPEGGQENQFANPDAVRVMTIHQAKGMQWPVVFIPALLKNRFPAKKVNGRNVWHLIPKKGIMCQERFEGMTEDERRLFYVAMTRSQKFLHMTWAPTPNNRNTKYCSEFWEDVLVSKWVKRQRPDYLKRRKLKPTPRTGVANVVFSFSDIKYFLECPYQFKLRVLYGFNAPIHEALGYGKSLHDALAEVHARALRGDYVDGKDVPDLVDTHLHVPYAYPALKQNLEVSAGRVILDYLNDNRDFFDKIEFSEKKIEIRLEDGVTVNGRIDLVRRLDTGETTIVDLKSNERVQSEAVTEAQLHVYALGYQELTGRRPDYVEVYELDERKRRPRSVDDEFICDVKEKVHTAARAMRSGDLPPAPSKTVCKACDYRGMCGKCLIQ